MTDSCIWSHFVSSSSSVGDSMFKLKKKYLGLSVSHHLTGTCCWERAHRAAGKARSSCLLWAIVISFFGHRGVDYTWRIVFDKVSSQVLWPKKTILCCLAVERRGSWCPTSVAVLFYTKPLVSVFYVWDPE